jgi:membrane fusion protein, copper/silver efflux system
MNHTPAQDTPAAHPPTPPTPIPPPGADTARVLLGLCLLLAAAVAVLGYLLWQAHGHSGATMPMSGTGAAGAATAGMAAAGTAPPGAATQDPSNWSIPQGEEATRRHIRDGLRAGDVDPVTGLRIINYHDPMVPGRNFDAPAKSPFMDMMLVPRYAGGSAEDAGTVSVSPRIQQNLGLRTAEVQTGSLQTETLAVGSIAWNERDQTTVSSRALGFVERLHVRATFDTVARGAPLLDIYVPDWVAAQEDYLALARMSGSGLEPLREAALQRMRQAGMSPVQIEQVQHTGTLQARFTLRAPQAGTVTTLMVREGATVMPGMPLLTLQGTSSVWAEAEVPESEVALLRPGMAFQATTPAVPGQTFEGKVQALLPAVDPATRTLKVRTQLNNPGGRLVPGLFVQMRFPANPGASTLLVPSDAVIRTGRRNLVMVAEPEGRFRPVEVELGREAGGQTEVLAGLQSGQNVVLSGQFLIDSEASLRGVETRLNREPTYQTSATLDAFDGDTVTLTHPPIAELNWPTMTMDFRLPPPERQPRDLAAGESVEIDFQMQEGDIPVITEIRRVAPTPGGTR